MWKNQFSMLLLVLTICLLSFTAVGTERAYACSCMAFESYTAALENSSHVLDAMVVNKKAVKKNKSNVTSVTLSVSAKWKGEAEHQMNVITSSSSASCGYEFEAGKRYAVFANERDGELHVSLCSATTLIADDSPIFEELGSPEELPFTRTDEDGVITTAAEGSEDSLDPNHPDQIKTSVSTPELEQRLDAQKSVFIIVFASIGGLLIIGAIAMLLLRRRR